MINKDYAHMRNRRRPKKTRVLVVDPATDGTIGAVVHEMWVEELSEDWMRTVVGEKIEYVRLDKDNRIVCNAVGLYEITSNLRISVMGAAPLLGKLIVVGHRAGLGTCSTRLDHEAVILSLRGGLITEAQRSDARKVRFRN